MTARKEFADALESEIDRMKSIIQEMDYPRNSEMWGNGLMTQIRAEHLHRLLALRAFYKESSDE